MKVPPCYGQKGHDGSLKGSDHCAENIAFDTGKDLWRIFQPTKTSYADESGNIAKIGNVQKKGSKHKYQVGPPHTYRIIHRPCVYLPHYIHRPQTALSSAYSGNNVVTTHLPSEKDTLGYIAFMYITTTFTN